MNETSTIKSFKTCSLGMGILRKKNLIPFEGYIYIYIYTHTTLHQAPIDLLGKFFNLVIIVFNSTSDN